MVIPILSEHLHRSKILDERKYRMTFKTNNILHKKVLTNMKTKKSNVIYRIECSGNSKETCNKKKLPINKRISPAKTKYYFLYIFLLNKFVLVSILPKPCPHRPCHNMSFVPATLVHRKIALHCHPKH